MNIAIDGPAGAGKSTIAKLVSKKLGSVYIDTGAMYRSMALYCINNNIDISDEDKVKSVLDEISLDIKYINDKQVIYLNGKDVSEEIRKENVGNGASAISVYADVRSRLVSLQRDLASRTSVVMDGRDIGSVVLPDAKVKIYLTASVETRAKRRYKELIDKGMSADIEAIKKDIEERDYRDMHRENSPLIQVEDAVLVDTSDMSIEEVVDEIISIYNSRV